MIRRATPPALALAVVLLLSGCTAPAPDTAPGQHFQTLTGAAVTLSVGNQRFALAVFAPPVPLLLVRTGPMFFWLTPSAGLREIFLDDEVNGVPVDTHVLEVNASGTMDCTYTFRW